MSVAGLKKQFYKASQVVSEKVGEAEGTKLDDDFKEMEKVGVPGTVHTSGGQRGLHHSASVSNVPTLALFAEGGCYQQGRGRGAGQNHRVPTA